MKKVLVVAVHPDDETLGCGGTILKHKSDGDEIHWLTVTTLTGSHFPEQAQERRLKEIQQVNEAYGFKSTYHLDFITTQIEEYPKGQLIGEISKVISDLQPNVIYLQHKYDVHSEHGAVFDAVFSCTKSFRYPYVKEVYTMETLSETEFAPSYMANTFVPNVFVDVSEHLDRKIEIMRIYDSELHEHPFPRSERNLKALATMRGATAGVEYAEAFMCLKMIR